MSSSDADNYHKELGQLFNDNFVEKFEVPEFVEALLQSLLNEYARIYWNHFQEECPIFQGFYRPDTPGSEGQSLHTPGLMVRTYWWGDPYARHNDDKFEPLVGEEDKPNFEFGNVHIHWYKHPGRGLSTNVVYSEAEWVAWYDAAMKVIRAAETPLY